MPYYIGELKRDPNLENHPYGSQGLLIRVLLLRALKFEGNQGKRCGEDLSMQLCTCCLVPNGSHIFTRLSDPDRK